MTMPPAGPPPGYQGPQGPQGAPQRTPEGYGDPTMAISRPDQQRPPREQQAEQHPQRAASEPRPPGSGAVVVLGVISLLGVILGLSIDDHGANAWGSVHLWGAVAVLGALVVPAPALGRSVGLSAQRAWQVAAAGAGALVLFWVLFVLPSVGSNTSLLTTIGVAAGLFAVWIAPGRAGTPGDSSSDW